MKPPRISADFNLAVYMDSPANHLNIHAKTHPSNHYAKLKQVILSCISSIFYFSLIIFSKNMQIYVYCLYCQLCENIHLSKFVQKNLIWIKYCTTIRLFAAKHHGNPSLNYKIYGHSNMPPIKIYVSIEPMLFIFWYQISTEWLFRWMRKETCFYDIFSNLSHFIWLKFISSIKVS